MAESIESLLERALTSPLGLAISTPSYNSACYIRRKLYAFRERKRREGNNQYDSLSFISKDNGELHIVKRPAIENVETVDLLESRLLKADDCPKRIIARGKHKPGLLAQMLVQSLCGIDDKTA